MKINNCNHILIGKNRWMKITQVERGYAKINTDFSSGRSIRLYSYFGRLSPWLINKSYGSQ